MATLFEQCTLKGLVLRNRLVRSATYEKRADVDGFVTESLLQMYRELADGGVGLIVTGNALVHVSGRSLPQMLCIHNDFYIEKLKRLTDAVHRREARIIIQLIHGGRQCFSSLLGGQPPIAPSAVPDPTKNVTPREMTSEEIEEIVNAFGSAARRAMYAGFDGVQIHAAHGYLVNQFLSPYTNRREDYWGGDEERRFHFLEELYKAIRDEVGDHFPVMIKLNTDDFIEGGITLDDSLRIAKRLDFLGIDAIEVSGGMHEAGAKSAQPNILTREQEAYFRRSARAFKTFLKAPIMLVGGIRSKSIAEDVLQSGDADFISLSRPLIREPDLPKRFMEGKEKADCISCNGCFRFLRLDMVKCTQIHKSAASQEGA